MRHLVTWAPSWGITDGDFIGGDGWGCACSHAGCYCFSIHSPVWVLVSYQESTFERSWDRGAVSLGDKGVEGVLCYLGSP